MKNQFDIIVVGAGHAGIEAALSSARLGANTLVVTTNLERIGFMSCNPAIGGLAKGHMVREIDALGGEMGVATDESCIQFKRLNATKGPAVRGSRAQCDKDLYVSHMIETFKNQKNLSLLQGEAKSLILSGSKCLGIKIQDGSEIFAKKVIITTGTFMNAVMHVGLEQQAGGRVGDNATVGLSDQLKSFGFNVFRLKTGTPPRLLRDSIDFSVMTPQPGDQKFYPFSFKSGKNYKLPQVDCHLSHTTELTHEIIRKNLDKSPIYCGMIEGTGPRYCPSIEDKVTRFAEKIRHQTFLEPEGLSTDHIYLQGISTSLPADIQDQFIRTIKGLENVKFARYGYAVEYDFIEPTQIRATLETRAIENLYLAGQINGTSGYEEAAAQGFMAGVNAAQSLQDKDPVILRRDQAYIGVLIDDLVTKGTKEPYRMFTSRAEHRLVLREDNTLDRLLDLGRDIGLITSEDFDRVSLIREKRNAQKNYLRSTTIYPNKETNEKLVAMGTQEILKPTTLDTLLRRAEISTEKIGTMGHNLNMDPEILEPVEIEIKYEGYIKRQKELIEQSSRLETYKLDESMDYSKVRGLSAEEMEKLLKVKPLTIGQAQRISGVNPSAIQAILIHIKGRKKIHQLETHN
ncbi:MAG: tRNA uridine-5-carboxymethylaminomethyl(34) synthesis enzyme MnmG [Bdellovibrionota bacterium]